MELARNAESPLKTVREMPQFPMKFGAQTDQEYLETCRGISPVMRDRYGCITTFSMANLLLLLDDRFSRQVELEGLQASGVKDGPAYDFVRRVLLFSNGQTHRTRRGPLTRTFAQPLMRALRPQVAARVDTMVSDMVRQGQADFIDALAGPLPAATIASIIGAPEEDSLQFSNWAYAASKGMGICTAEERKRADVALVELTDYIEALLARRRARPEEDFLTSYLDKVEGGPMDADEIRTQIVGLVIAGSDTTRGSLTATVSHLMQNRDQWDLLVADPETHAPGAVSEGLRFDPIIGSLARITVEDIELEGYAIPKGRLVTPSMIAALRDPAVYADPNRFDITRTDHPRHHAVFGGGPHRCLGEVLARIELEEALKSLARKAPDLRVDGKPGALSGFSATRMVKSMNVTI